MLRREGWHVNRKRIYRLYVDMGLQVRLKKRKKHAGHIRVPITAPTATNERWSMDFVSDRLMNGGQFRILVVLDQFRRECPLAIADQSLTGQKVVEHFENIRWSRGYPKTITVDNGTEFVSKAMDEWAYKNGIHLDYIRPGRPAENAFVESFNGKLRDEFLNANIFFSLKDAQSKLDTWRIDYNTQRPHTSIDGMTPVEYAEKHKNGLWEGKILNLKMV
jgi:putative transposase